MYDPQAYKDAKQNSGYTTSSHTCTRMAAKQNSGYTKSSHTCLWRKATRVYGETTGAATSADGSTMQPATATDAAGKDGAKTASLQALHGHPNSDLVCDWSSPKCGLSSHWPTADVARRSHRVRSPVQPRACNHHSKNTHRPTPGNHLETDTTPTARYSQRTERRRGDRNLRSGTEAPAAAPDLPRGDPMQCRS